MFALVLSILSVAGLQIPLVLANSSPKIVDLGYAKYASDLSLTDGVTSFLGIRYAAPPTGKLRWKAPQGPATVTGVQNATTQPHQCFQASITGSSGLSAKNPFRKRSRHRRDIEFKMENEYKRDTDGVSDEDCLFLNVHIPSAPQTQSLLPVIVYIHGGGYDAGNVSLYPVHDFVKATNNGVVAVQIQYRLGLFGFLAGKKVKEGGNLNAGLLDQRFALQWVQQHIALFGGDRSKVAIWGQSAGAGSMLQHIVANGGNTQPTLFRAVLMNSPFLPFQYQYNDPIPEKLYSNVVSSVNCGSSQNTLACLRTASASSLLAADTNIGSSNFLGSYTFVPVVDGTLIIERPTVTLKRGRVNGAALLVSTNTNEGTLFVPSDFIIGHNFTLTEYVTELFPRLSQAQIQQAVGLYSNDGLSAVPDQAAAVMGDSIFVCPAYYALTAFGQKGRKAEFALPPGTHAEDLSYEFSTIGIPRSFTDPDFAKAFQQSFLSTAISLDPNTKFDPTNITPSWASWSSGHTEMLFNKTENDAPVVKTFATDAGILKRCDFWSSVSAVTSQ